VSGWWGLTSVLYMQYSDQDLKDEKFFLTSRSPFNAGHLLLYIFPCHVYGAS